MMVREGLPVKTIFELNERKGSHENTWGSEAQAEGTARACHAEDLETKKYQRGSPASFSHI